MLGETVANAIQEGELSSMKQPSLAVRTTKVTAPLQKITEADIAKATAKMDRVGTPGFPFTEAVEACKVMDIVRLKKRGAMQCRSKYRRFAWMKTPRSSRCRPKSLSRSAWRSKRQSPFKTTLVVELANDSRRLHSDEAGIRGRQLRGDEFARRAGTGEKLVEAAVGCSRS